MKIPPLFSRWFLPKKPESVPVVESVPIVLEGDMVESLGPGYTRITTKHFDRAVDESYWLPAYTDSKEVH